ncbi:TetR family transcriptional regulator [Flavobacterium sp. Sd200]|uniref:TetR/AcrR family transcriptional regulator n=1 Tax=Flavobacterium sp. Sd200 TaxID=2692211 RepID=UPI001367B169|nr:TetR/AcrR family transcriptional regulator [Flavobacterium sp. Sd200]MXN90302.1 TetR family transcriptional regulator [Flavobacterium sp. Sd200]
MINDSNREKIKDAAINLVLTQGIFHPSTAEITVTAGVSRTLLHYYFKDKKEIEELVCQHAMGLYRLKTQQLFITEIGMRERISEFSETAFAFAASYPFLDIFIITASGNNTEIQHFLTEQNFKIQAFIKELDMFFEENSLHDLTAEHFLIQLLSVINLPLDVIFQSIYLCENGQRNLCTAKQYKIVLKELIANILSKFTV